MLQNPPSPVHLKYSSYIIQSLAFPGKKAANTTEFLFTFSIEANKEVIRENSGIKTIVSTLEQTLATFEEVAANCFSALVLLTANGN